MGRLLRTSVHLLLVGFTLLFLSGCGGGGGGSAASSGAGSEGPGPTPPPPGDPPPGPPPGNAPSPTFDGFTFALAEGDFWEYRWNYHEGTYAMGSDPVNTYDSGRFRLTLGAPALRSGKTAYPVILSGRSTARDGNDLKPRWTYLALDNSVFYGSVDGSAFLPVFDAFNGHQAGGGFFSDFGTGALLTGTVEAFQNAYFSDPSAIAIKRSASQSECEEIAGELICGDTAFNWDERDYFLAGIGPVGRKFSRSQTFSGGGFLSTHDAQDNVGLVLTSLRDESADYDLEAEPDETLATARRLTNRRVVLGDARRSDPGYFNGGILTDAGYTDQQAEDLYEIVIPAPGTVRITLTFADAQNGTDLDLYLFRNSLFGGVNVVGSSVDPNSVEKREVIVHNQLSAELNQWPVTVWAGVVAINDLPANAPRPEYRISYEYTPGSVPAAPYNLRKTARTENSVSLAWTDNSTSETGFVLERSASAGGTFSPVATLAANAASRTDGSLLPWTQYWYQVKATAAGGDSGYSNVLNVITLGSLTGDWALVGRVQCGTTISPQTALLSLTQGGTSISGSASGFLASVSGTAGGESVTLRGNSLAGTVNLDLTVNAATKRLSGTGKLTGSSCVGGNITNVVMTPR